MSRVLRLVAICSSLTVCASCIEPRVVEERRTSTMTAGTSGSASSAGGDGTGGMDSSFDSAGAGGVPALARPCLGPAPESIALAPPYAFFGASGPLQRVPLSGGRAEQFGPAEVEAHGVAVDDAHVYVGAVDIYEVTLADGAARPLEKVPTTIQALAVHDGHLYIAAFGKVARTPTHGGPVETLGEPALPIDVAVDASGVYFTVADLDEVEAHALSLMYTRHDGSSEPIELVRVVEPSVSVGTLGEATPRSRGLALTTESIYFSNAASLYRVPKGGGITRRLAEGSSTVTGIAADGTSTYWSSCDGTIRRVGARWGTPATVASDRESPAIAGVDAHTVRWIHRTAGGFELETLAK